MTETVENCDYLLTEDEEFQLQELLKEKGITNYTKTIEAGSKKGENYLGKILRIIIKNENTQFNLILKCSVRNGTFRNFLPHNKMFEREIFMYKNYLPELYKIQNDHNIVIGLQSVPKLYKYSLEECKEFILMDDMKYFGYEMLDRRDYLNFEHCKLVLQQLAYFHGLGFVFKHTNPKLFHKMTVDKQMNLFVSNLLRNNMYKMKIIEMLTRASLALDPNDDEAILIKFLEYKNFMAKWMIDIEDPEQKDDFCCIVHNDCWNNNLLFQYKNAKANSSVSKSLPNKLGIIDWQVANINSPVKDISYFLYHCTETNFLDTNFRSLIKYYYQQLTECVTKCHLNIDQVYPYQIFQKHLSRYMRHGVHYMILTGALHLSNLDDIPNHTETIGQSTSINAEYTCDTFNIQGKNDYMYNLRIKGIIKHAILNDFL